MDNVARGDQVEAIGHRVAAVTEEVKKVHRRVDAVEGRVEDIRGELDALRARVEAGVNSEPCRAPTRPTGSSSSGSRPDIDSRDEWFRRLIHFRGWAPYGADCAKKLDKSEAAELQRRIMADLIPSDDAANVRWLQPFHLNHRLTLELLAPKPSRPSTLPTT